MDPGTRRFIGIILVAVMLLAGLLGTLMLLPQPEGDNDDDGNGNGPSGWEVRGDIMFIEDDVQWKGLDERMEYPVSIEPEASLTIVDSDIRVALEDLIFWEAPAFNISWGGTLALSNSNLTIDAHPGLKNALLDTEIYSQMAPVIWRAVNLLDAVDPVLEFDVEFLRGYSNVVVAVQRTPDDRLEPLEVLNAEEVGLREWADVRVSLHEYVGSAPRVALFVHNSTAYDAILTNVRVTDGGEPLKGDILGKGNLYDDGWAEEHFGTFLSVIDRYSYDDYELHIQPLVSGRGDVSIVDSNVLSSPGLRRDWRGYYPMAAGKPNKGLGAIEWTSPKRGGIDIMGDLEVLRSQVTYVPITVAYGSTHLTDSSFIGDCEVVTLLGGDATVEGCDLAFVSGDGIWNDNLNLGNTWLLAIESPDDLSTVEGCSFSGEGIGIGLHLNRATVDIDNNAFTGLGAGLWVHEVEEDMKWSSVGPAMDFDPSCDLYYLETHECTVDFEGTNEPWVGTNEPVQWGRERLEELPALGEIFMAEYETPHYSVFSVPVLLVGPDIGVHLVEEVSVHVSPHWHEGKTVFFSPQERTVVVYLEENEVQPGYTYFYSPIFDVGNVSGALFHRMRAYADMTWLEDPYVNVTMDGRFLERIDINESDYNWSDGSANIDLVHSIPPGPHEMNVSMAASWYEFHEYIIELDYVKFWVYRMTGNETWEDVADWLAGRSHGIVMVDAGVRLEGIEHNMTGHELSYQRLVILTWEGSHLGFDSFRTTYQWMSFTTSGNGTMDFVDLDLYGYHTIRNVTLTIDSLTSPYYYMESYGAHVEYTGSIEAGTCFMQNMNGTEVIIDGVDISLEDALDIYGFGSHLTLRDSSITTDGMATAYIGTIYGAVTVVESCTFTGVPLAVRFHDVNNSWFVEDCTFIGHRAFMTLEMGNWVHIDGADPSLVIPHNASISGNRFSGEGSGFLFDVELLGLMEDNRVSDGAKAYVRYSPEVVVAGTGYNTYNMSTLDCYDFYKLGRLAYTSNEDAYNLLLDVSADPLDVADPGYVPVVVWVTSTPSSSRGYVSGFTQIPIASDQMIVRGVEWDNIYASIDVMLEDFNIEDNWWTG
jgi:hypothetical protein